MLIRLIVVCCMWGVLASCDREKDTVGFLFSQIPVRVNGFFGDQFVRSEIDGEKAYVSLSVIDNRTGKEYIRSCFYLSVEIIGKASILKPEKIVDRHFDAWTELNLQPGEYTVLAWIDYRSNENASFYDTTDLRAVTMKEVSAKGVKVAYAACSELSIEGNRRTDRISLFFYNPLAEYRIVTVQKNKMLCGHNVLLSYRGYCPTVYDILEGCCTAAVKNPAFRYTAFADGPDVCCLFKGALFADRYKRPAVELCLFVGNALGHLLYQTDYIRFDLTPGEEKTVDIHPDDFFDYADNGIIDDAVAGNIDIEIRPEK